LNPDIEKSEEQIILLETYIYLYIDLINVFACLKIRDKNAREKKNRERTGEKRTNSSKELE
jgi:hypothetical protein